MKSSYLMLFFFIVCAKRRHHHEKHRKRIQTRNYYKKVRQNPRINNEVDYKVKHFACERDSFRANQKLFVLG